MAKQMVTLFIRDSSINLLVMRGNKVKKWASLPLEPGLLSQGLVGDEAQLAGKVKELFKLAKVSTGKIIAGLSGHGSLYRLITLPALPEAILTEAVRNEARRVLPLSLDEVYLAYQSIPAPKGETHVFLAAFPRNVVDALLRTLRRAGLDPYLMDLAPLALSRIPDEPRAIIVHVGLDHLDIIVVADRLPQLVHRLSLPSEAESLSERLPTVTEELNRTVAFYNSSHLEKPLDATVPLFVYGELAQAPESWPSLVGKLNYPVSPLPSPVQSPEGFDPDQFMVNIGLALKEIPRDKEGANFSIIKLNTMPEVYLPKPFPVAKILAPVGIVIGISLLIYGGSFIRSGIAHTDALRSQLVLMESRITQQQREIPPLKEQIEPVAAQIEPLSGQIKRVEATADVVGDTLSSLAQARGRVDRDLSQSVSVMPLGIDLTGVNHAGGTVTVNGITPDEANIFNYARELRNSGRFSAVIISSIEAIEVEEEEEENEDEEAAEIKEFRFNFLLKWEE